MGAHRLARHPDLRHGALPSDRARAHCARTLHPVSCWTVETRGGQLFVREKWPEKKRPAGSTKAPGNVIIVGGRAAGSAAAEMLRREGYSGGVTMIRADDAAPYDRPNLSKDFLAGNANEEWIPLHSHMMLSSEQFRNRYRRFEFTSLRQRVTTNRYR
jgi:apoptosis-inducing factor 3